MGDMRRDVHHAGHAVQRIEVLRKALPLPIDAFGQRRAGNVLHALHQLDQPVALLGPGRREPHAAIAEHRGGDTVPRRRGQLGVPRCLAVVVGMDVDPSRRHQPTSSVDLLGASADVGADLGDGAVPVDRDIGVSGRRAGAVHQMRVADHEFVHGSPPLRS